MATVTFTGNVANPDLKFANGSGKAYFNFSVAERHRKKNRESGQYEDAGTTWRRVTYFGNGLFTAEALAEQVVKGAHVIVTGDEVTEEYQKNDGTPGSSITVIPQPGCVGVVPKASRDGAAAPAAAGAWSNPQQPQQAAQGAWNQQGAPAAAWNQNTPQNGAQQFPGAPF